MKKNTKLLDEMLKSLRKMNDMKIRWGFTDQESYDDPRGITSVAEIAQLVEEGHDNGGMFPNTKTPPRPFFKTAVTDSNNHAAVRAKIKHLQRKVLQGKITPEEKFEELGDLLTKQLIESIDNFDGEELSETTEYVRRQRGITGTDPLIETGTLRDSVAYEVEYV